MFIVSVEDLKRRRAPRDFFALPAEMALLAAVFTLLSPAVATDGQPHIIFFMASSPWGPPIYPNASQPMGGGCKCSRECWAFSPLLRRRAQIDGQPINCDKGCLFNASPPSPPLRNIISGRANDAVLAQVLRDPSERDELSASEPAQKRRV